MRKDIPILIDFDGVINIGGNLANDAADFLNLLEVNNIPSQIISNATLRSGKEITSFLKSYSLPFQIPCMTTVDATVKYLKSKKIKVSVYCDDKVKQYFSDFMTENNPDAVVLGDLGNKWTYEILNEIFNKVLNGAEIIAMQINKFWIKKDNPELDAGAFVSAIEYATDKKAVVIGKPSPIYFKEALKSLGFSEESKFIMIGDDLDNDIGGAQSLGAKGILIYTGKTTKEIAANSKIKPNWEVNNLSEIKEILLNL